jgi:hypothetical protein
MMKSTIFSTVFDFTRKGQIEAISKVEKSRKA